MWQSQVEIKYYSVQTKLVLVQFEHQAHTSTVYIMLYFILHIGYSARARQFSDSNNIAPVHVLYIMLQVLRMLEDTAYLMQSSLKAEKEQ